MGLSARLCKDGTWSARGGRMKSVIISIRPQWVEKIASGKKTIEVRKSAPQEVPFKAYIYCTKQKINGEILFYERKVEGRNRGFRDKGDIPLAGKVIGEFICDKVYPIKNKGNSFVVANEKQSVTNEIAGQSCLYYDDMVSYFGNKDGFGWHISDLKIYDKPKELSEFKTPPCEKSEKACGNCKWLVKINTSVDYECECYVCSVANGIPITRPPQSWQYVEEL